MQYFTVQGRSNREAIERMRATYGEDARILTHRTVRLGGLLGLFTREGVEVTGYLSEEGGRRRHPEAGVEDEKPLLSQRMGVYSLALGVVGGSLLQLAVMSPGLRDNLQWDALHRQH